MPRLRARGFHAPLTPLPPAGVALSARFHFAPFGCCVCSLAEGRGGKVRFEVRGMEGDGFAACPIWCRVGRRGRGEMGDFCSLSLPPEKNFAHCHVHFYMEVRVEEEEEWSFFAL